MKLRGWAVFKITSFDHIFGQLVKSCAPILTNYGLGYTLGDFPQKHIRSPWFHVRKETEDSVARWFVSKPKIPNWVKFGGPCSGKSWYIL
jgi:hypothetical protein